jgi:hypothetical protein
VRYALTELSKLGEIAIEYGEGPRGTNVYRLAKMEGQTLQGENFAGGKITPREGQNPTKTRVDFAPEPSKTLTVQNRPGANPKMIKIGNAKSFWRDVLRAVAANGLNPRQFETWALPTRLLGIEAGEPVIGVPTEEFRLWLQENCEGKLLSAIREAGEEVRGIKFAVTGG